MAAAQSLLQVSIAESEWAAGGILPLRSQCTEPLCTANEHFHEDCESASCSSEGAYFLMRYYCERYAQGDFEPGSDPFAHEFSPRRNDFGRAADYFVQKV